MKRTSKPKPEVSPELAAVRRLSKEGASSNAAIRKRIALIAAERKLDPSETKALMTGRRIPDHAFCQFAEKHHLSFDWLLCGDLKGRHRMAQRCPSLPRQDVVRPYTSEEFAEAMDQLDPKARDFITGYMRLLLDGGGAA